MKAERDIKAEVLAELGADARFLVWNHPTGTGRTLTPPHSVVRFGLPGSADIIGVCQGRAIAVECKTVEGYQTPEQRKFQRAWEARGGIYEIARGAETIKARILARL